jgi:hypothetical protein
MTEIVVYFYILYVNILLFASFSIVAVSEDLCVWLHEAEPLVNTEMKTNNIPQIRVDNTVRS